MAKKTTNKKVNVIKEEKDKEVSLDVEKKENVENTILDAEKKDSEIIRKALEDQEQDEKPTTTNEEKVEQVKPIEDTVKNEDTQDNKQNSANKVNTAKRKISKLFGYYWNGQMMD